MACCAAPKKKKRGPPAAFIGTQEFEIAGILYLLYVATVLP